MYFSYAANFIYLLYGVQQIFCRDVKPQNETRLPDYNVYHNLSHIQSHLREIVKRHPDFMHINWTYSSRLGMPQMLIRITNFTARRNPSTNASLVRVLLSYGEHPREFLPVESLFHFLEVISHELTVLPHSTVSGLTQSLVLSFDLFIVAMLNPDGRHLVEQTGNYCWRGTSTGVDLNRNFDWSYGRQGSSANRNDEEYRGDWPFSEPEGHVLKSLTLQYDFDAFISLHSGIRQIYVPYADSLSRQNHRKPANVQAMLQLARLMSTAGQHTFQYGLAYKLNKYPADGTIFDFMAGVRKIPFSLAIELWGVGDNGDTKCFDLFNPENEKLQTEVQAIHPLYVTLFGYLLHWKQNQTNQKMLGRRLNPSHVPYVLLIGILLMLAMFSVRFKRRFTLQRRRWLVSLQNLVAMLIINRK